MRKIVLVLLITIFTNAVLQAQVKIGDSPQNIDASSVLELESTDKVLVITRVSTAQMNAITPLQGALCYNTDLQSVHYYDGTQWVNVGGGGGTDDLLTSQAIVNTPQETIVITPTADGNNLEVAPNSISSAQIQDGTIDNEDIADGAIGGEKLLNLSVTSEKLSENSVNAFAIDNANLGVSAFNNDAGYINLTDVVSGDPDNALQIGLDGGAFYDEMPLMNAIEDNTTAINNIGIPTLNEVLQEGNNALDVKITGLSEPENPADAATKVYVDTEITAAITASGSPNPTDELIQDGEVIGNDLIINEGVGANAKQTIIDVSALVGGGGSVADLTTITGTGIPTDPFKIEPSPTVGQYLRTTAAGVVNWDDLPTGTGGAVSSDGLTIVGDGVASDLSVATDGIATEQIKDATIRTTDLNQNGATDGQILKWDDATTAWILANDDNTISSLTNANILVGDMTNTPQSVPLTGDATIDNVGEITIEPDAITAAKLDRMGATDGQVMKWVADDTSTDPEVGEWVAANSVDHIGIANNVFFASTDDGRPIDTSDTPSTIDNGGFFWDSTKRFDTGALYLGMKANGNTDGTSVIEANIEGESKLIVAERLGLREGGLALPIQIRNETNDPNTGTGILFNVNAEGNPGKAALAFQRGTTELDGSFHFLISDTAPNKPPTLDEKAFTITSEKHIGLYGGIDIDGAGTGFGTNNQVLASSGPNLPVKWVDAVGHSGSEAGSIFFSGAAPNFEPIDNNAQLFWDNTATKLYIGPQISTADDVKLNVGGTTRTQGIKNSDGSAATPSYRFTGDLSSGMYSIDEGDLGFSAGGTPAIRIDGTTAGTANVIINQSLELDGVLVDEGGNTGLPSQVLSATATGTAWVDPSETILKAKVLSNSILGGGNGRYSVKIPKQASSDYIINVSVLQNALGNPITIQVVGQGEDLFTVQIYEQDLNGKFVGKNATWYYTIYNP